MTCHHVPYEVGLATKIRIFFGIFRPFQEFVENYRIFRNLEGFLEILVNIFKVFLFICCKKKLETWKSFFTSDPEASVCNVLMCPFKVSVSGFTP